MTFAAVHNWRIEHASDRMLLESMVTLNSKSCVGQLILFSLSPPRRLCFHPCQFVCMKDYTKFALCITMKLGGQVPYWSGRTNLTWVDPDQGVDPGFCIPFFNIAGF